MPKEMDHLQQIGEPTLWYGRFMAYLMLGPTRSHTDVLIAEWRANPKNQNKPLPKKKWRASGMWREMAVRWDWQGRCERYDREKQDAELDLWELREKEMREKKFALGSILVSKAETLAKHPHIAVVVPGQNGQPDRVLEPPRWDYADAANLATVGMELAESAITNERANKLKVDLMTEHAPSQRAIDDIQFLQEFVKPALPPGTVLPSEPEPLPDEVSLPENGNVPMPEDPPLPDNPMAGEAV